MSASVMISRRAPSPPRERTVWGSIGRQWPEVVIGVGAIALWEALARTVLADRYTLAAPTAIVGELFDNFGLYMRNLGHTGWNAVQAFWWGNLIALAMAAVIVAVPLSRQLVLSVALTISCLPLVALAPILRVVLGPGESTAITLGAIAVIYTSLTAGVLGLKAASPSTLDVVTAGGRGRWFALRAVRAPTAVPAVFAGLQISAPAAFLGALIGEFTGASKGFGILTIRALATLDPDRVWTVAALSTIVTSGAYFLIGFIGRRLTPWSAITTTAAPPITTSHSLAAGSLISIGRMALSIGAVMGAWVLLLRWSNLNAFFAKGPDDVWRYLVSGPDAAAHRSEVLDPLGETLVTASFGFALGLIGAVVVAGLLVAVPLLKRVVLPLAIAIRSVPIVATTPLLILLFGREQLGAVVIVAAMSFFPTLVACLAAMERVPGQILDVMQSYNAGRVAMFFRARLPATLPALASSARVAVPASLLGATVAEWLATGKGIGNLMTVAAGTTQYNTLWACVATLTLVAVAAHAFVSVVESVVLGRFAPEQRS